MFKYALSLFSGTGTIVRHLDTSYPHFKRTFRIFFLTSVIALTGSAITHRRRQTAESHDQLFEIFLIILSELKLIQWCNLCAEGEGGYRDLDIVILRNWFYLYLPFFFHLSSQTLTYFLSPLFILYFSIIFIFGPFNGLAFPVKEDFISSGRLFLFSPYTIHSHPLPSIMWCGNKETKQKY